MPESFTEESINETFSKFGEILRIKFLPARDDMNGKAWIALDSAEAAEQAKSEIGGDSGDWEVDG